MASGAVQPERAECCDWKRIQQEGAPPRKYVEAPFDVFPKTEAEEAAEMEKKQKELIAKLSAWKTLFDANKKQ